MSLLNQSIRPILRVSRVCRVAGHQYQRCRLLSTELKERIDGLVQAKKVVVFMKGVPEAPQCGFSNAVSITYDFQIPLITNAIPTHWPESQDD